MTQRERFHAIMHGEPADELCQFEAGYWAETLDNWRREGLPADVTPWDHFGITWYEHTPVQWGIWPHFAVETVAEDEDTVTYRDETGVLARRRKDGHSMPHWLDFPVKTLADFERLAEEHLDPTTPGRYPDDWDQQVARWQTRDHILVVGNVAASFFGWPRSLMGVQNLLLAYYDHPELIRAINDQHLEFIKVLYERALQEVEFDFAFIWEDMAFKTGPLIGPALFREFMLPYYLELTDYFRSFGIELCIVDSDGNIADLIPCFIEGGIDGLLPLEVAAGMDVRAVREAYPELRLLGGVDKRALAAGPEAIDAELARRMRGVVGKGRYLPGVDHHLPPDVPLEHFAYYLQQARELYREETCRV
jgi:hypothetical protein